MIALSSKCSQRLPANLQRHCMLVHHSVRLLLLSSINGDAPSAWQNWRRRFGWFESRPISTFRSRSLTEHTNQAPSLPTVTSEANFDSRASFIPPTEERYNYSYVYETICRQSRVPDFERRSATTILSGRHGRVRIGRRRP